MKRWTAIVQHKLAAALDAPLTITGQLSDQQIIDLHNCFLTIGFQHIQVSNEHEGRKLMGTLLASLDYYQNVACLTDSDIQLYPSIYDISTYLIEARYVPKNLESFFFEQHEFDFMWIELTPSLIAQSWFEEFKVLLVSHNLHIAMPIVCLSYGKI